MSQENSLSSADTLLSSGSPGDALPNSDAKNLAVIFTICSVFFGPLSPLVGYLTSAEKPWLKRQMTELLNFQISVMIVLVVAVLLESTVVLAVIGLPLMLIVGIGNLVCIVLGALKASKGEFKKYPWTLRLLT